MTQFTFTVEHVTPEQQLHNDAFCIVHHYQRPKLGWRQREMLVRMLDSRGRAFFGSTYTNRKVLGSLKTRKLVTSTVPESNTLDYWDSITYWDLTDLGREVAQIIAVE